MTTLFTPMTLWNASSHTSSELDASTGRSADAGVELGLPELIAVSDVASVFGRSERTIRRWIENGSLPALSAGRSLFIRAEDVRALITEGMSRKAAKGRSRFKKNVGPEAHPDAPLEVYVSPD